MKIMITGVAGLLGSRLADWLMQNVQGCKIIGLDDLSGGYKENIHPDVEFIKINLTLYFIQFVMIFVVAIKLFS